MSSPAYSGSMRRMTVADLAQAHRLPERTLRRWVAEGRLTATRHRGRWWLSPGEVEQLLAWRTRNAT